MTYNFGAIQDNGNYRNCRRQPENPVSSGSFLIMDLLERSVITNLKTFYAVSGKLPFSLLHRHLTKFEHSSHIKSEVFFA